MGTPQTSGWNPHCAARGVVVARIAPARARRHVAREPVVVGTVLVTFAVVLVVEPEAGVVPAARDVVVARVAPARARRHIARELVVVGTVLVAFTVVLACVEINCWFGGSPPNFRTLYLGQIEVDSADFWTNRLLS